MEWDVALQSLIKLVHQTSCGIFLMMQSHNQHPLMTTYEAFLVHLKAKPKYEKPVPSGHFNAILRVQTHWDTLYFYVKRLCVKRHLSGALINELALLTSTLASSLLWHPQARPEANHPTFVEATEIFQTLKLDLCYLSEDSDPALD